MLSSMSAPSHFWAYYLSRRILSKETEIRSHRDLGRSHRSAAQKRRRQPEERACMDCESQKSRKNSMNLIFLQNPDRDVSVKISNFHHFCASAKTLPGGGLFLLLFRTFRDSREGQYGDPWSA